MRKANFIPAVSEMNQNIGEELESTKVLISNPLLFRKRSKNCYYSLNLILDPNTEFMFVASVNASF